MSDANSDTPAAPAPDRLPGRIEGGIDAIVIGAGADGLTAAAYLGRAGLRTVLVGAGAQIGGRISVRKIAPDVSVIDGEHLITQLDPDVIAELDLYRHGLDYAARRLETTYFFDSGEVLRFDGDLAQAALLSLEDDGERETLEAFMGEMMELAAYLRPAFQPALLSNRSGTQNRTLEKALAGASPELAVRLRQALFASADDVLRARFGDGALRTLLLSEAVFRTGAPPQEQFSFMSLLRRFAGEAAGLQGACAYPAGGVVSVVAALRRAAQSAKVDVRAATPVESILIEGDRVAGVTLTDGGQLRAPIVVGAIDAEQTFLKMIGPSAIEIELQRILTARRPELSSARLHLVLKGAPEDESTRQNMKRRLVYAPSPEAVAAAFIDARAGRIPEKLIVEAVFPTALDEEAALDKRQLMSVIAHPLPFDATPDASRREDIKAAILANIEVFASGLSERIEAADLRLAADEAADNSAGAGAYASKPDIVRQWALASAVIQAGQIDGFYFCGPEAQIGVGLSCAAGRAAARAALWAYRKGAP